MALFLSHAWGRDAQGRCTHARVARLKEEMQALGWTLWFDEDRLIVGQPLDAQLSHGIVGAAAVCLCITRAYCEKVNAGDVRDNVWKEWNLTQSIGKQTIPLIFEADMRDVRAWPPGAMTMVLGNTFYFDASGDDMHDAARRLSTMLVLLGLRRPAARQRRARLSTLGVPRGSSMPKKVPRTAIRV